MAEARRASRVFRTDIAAAQTESWWGKVITVTPEQIFELR